jgi:hypothetical protein
MVLSGEIGTGLWGAASPRSEFIGAPHSVQNFTLFAIGRPHLGQPLTAVPHSVQNRTPSFTGLPHFLHPLTAQPHSVQNFTSSSFGRLQLVQVFINLSRIK